MQSKSSRTNRERTDATRDALMSAARRLFVAKGYAETSTPEIAEAASVTRGALYHHFADKQDLFRAVLIKESRTLAEEIRAAETADMSARHALLAGTAAYLDAMTVPGRTRLLLIDGPAVLGLSATATLDGEHAGLTLKEGLSAVQGREQSIQTADALAVLVSAALDRAALEIASGNNPQAIRDAAIRLIERVMEV